MPMYFKKFSFSLILLVQLFTAPLFAQDGVAVRGTVLDGSGEPIIGANVLVKGTTTGVVTDVNGAFTITAPNRQSVLTFSYIGYSSKEITVGNQRDIKVVLEEDRLALDEVVVVGYGTQKRSELTGAIASVKSDDIKDVSAKSMSEALTGRIAGVMVTKGDGSPGASADIIIRGAATVNGLGPLYIVDGVRMGTDFKFNMRDVENIEVLKDAGSSAIYGAQAAGGVILITTKRGGASDKMKIDVNARYGIRNVLSNIDLLGRDDYIAARKNIGIDILALHHVSSTSELPDVDWMDEIYSVGKEQEYNLSMSGGTNKHNYFISGGYYREDGVYLDTWSQRFSFRVNADYKIGNRITVGESIYGSSTQNNPYREFVGTRGVPFRTAPTAEVYDPINLGGWAKMPSYIGGPNLYGNEYIYHYTGHNYNLDAVIYGNLKIIEGLDLRVTLGGAFGGTSSNAFTEAFDFGVLKQTQGSMQARAGTSQRLTFNTTLTYEKTFGNHTFKLMVGTEALKNDGYEVVANATGFTVPVAESLRLSSSVDKTAEDNWMIGRSLSYFGRLNYSYQGKYLFTANIRRDGSDRFGLNNRWGNFPSINGAWRISEESFVKDNADWLTNAKFRASWGILGNDGISQFLYSQVYQQLNRHQFNGGDKLQGWANTRFPNADIKWEEVNQTDIGLDLAFLKGKLSFTYDWYSRQTKDMLYTLNIPLSGGISTSNVPINIGQVSNIGSEISIDWRDTWNGLRYSVGFNASFNKNEMIKIGQEGAVLTDGNPGEAWRGNVSRTQDGQPIGQFYGYKAIGIFKDQAEVDAYNAKAKAAGAPSGFYQQRNTGPGDIIFADGDQGWVDANSQDFIGNPWPKMTYGINLSLAYKGFDLGLSFQGVAGVDIYNGLKAYTQNFYGDANTTKNIFNNSFFGSNGLTDMPRSGFFNQGSYVVDPNFNYSTISSFWVEKGDYLKLKNLSIGYTLPSSISRKAALQNTRIYLTAQNVFTITKYSGIDPELGGMTGTTANTNVRQRGIDTFTRYLPSRLISVGLDLTF
ncbi:SusC/RagA family TonB-linked outer membrane protein [Bacteroidia bacterium]|nr:SusC/RagA family TonB-linked outer membrane protein [Bacteroidia bacterium]